MLMRRWALLGSIAALVTITGCSKEQATTEVEEPAPAATVEVPAAPEGPELDSAGTDASFGVPAELPASAPPPGDPWWSEAVASCFAAARGYAVERQRPAPDALLAFGRDRAREALHQIVVDPEPRMDDEIPYTHRFMAAWCLCYEDLDHDRGTEVVLRYLRAMCDTEYVDPDIGRALHSPEEYAYAAAALYARTHDPELLHGVLAIAPCSDGALTEGLMTVYLRLALEDFDRFLAVLSQCTREQTAKVGWIIAKSLREEGGRSSNAWTELVSRLELVARSPEARHHDIARDLLVHLNEHVD